MTSFFLVIYLTIHILFLNVMVDGNVDYLSDMNGRTFTIAKGAYIIQSRVDQSAWITFSLDSKHSDSNVFLVKKDTRFEVLSVVDRISQIAEKSKSCYVVSEDLHYKFFIGCKNIELLSNRTKEINKALSYLEQGRRIYLEYEQKRKVEVSSYSKFYKKLEETYYFNAFKVGLIDE